MTELEIAYWSMVGTWVAGIATFGAVVVSLYLASTSRKTKLQLRLTSDSYGNLHLTVTNRGLVYAEIERISLGVKHRLVSKVLYRESQYFDLIDDYFESLALNPIQRGLMPNSKSLAFDFDRDSLHFQYGCFLPYQGEVLTRLVKMPKCYVGVFLKTGELFQVEVPDDFYITYRNAIGGKYDDRIYSLCFEPEKYIIYGSSKELYQKQQEALELYSKARRNYHLLLC
ncbi:hypothetical protein ACXLRA_004241 [Vibrio vulnificus]|nr:hypothetical protein [Vibrio vulnificus]